MKKKKKILNQTVQTDETNFNRELIKKTIPLLDIVDSYINMLQLEGDFYHGPCPFHQDISFTFALNTKSESFYCFDCGLTGDVVDFIMRIDEISEKAAMRLLVEKVLKKS